jgi:ATP phosphoribosyltransferase
MKNETRIRIAIQKSGRLSEASLKMISQAGIKLARSKDQLIAYGKNYPVDVLLTRDDDIPTLLNEGTCDIGIMGYNIYNEFNCSHGSDENSTNIVSAMDLPFGECRLSFASPYDSKIKSLGDCDGTKIATSYPATVSSYLKKMNINATCIEFKGSVEIAPKLGTCTLICDLVSTGTTLKANGLEEFHTLLNSSAQIFKYSKVTDIKSTIINNLLARFRSVVRASESKYITLHAPIDRLDTIISLLPGSESPTIIPLSNSIDKVAVHALCNEKVFWETLENLKSEGASSILVLPIEKLLD